MTVKPETIVQGPADKPPPPGTRATEPAALPRHPLNAVLDRVLVALFLLAVVLPLIGTFAHWDRKAVHENRKLADWPRVPHNGREAFRYPTELLKYFSDHFGFRNTLIETTNTAVYETVGLAHGKDVIVGREGWFFIHPNGGDLSFNTENGFNRFTTAQLDAWQSLLEKRFAAATARGIPVVMMIAPDKESIYPEFFPVEARRRRPSRLDQLVERLEQTHSPVHIVDVRPALLAGKAKSELYRRTDTHWNDEGAWIAYEELLAAIGRALPGFATQPQPRTNFHVRDEGQKSGDLVGLLALDGLITEHWTWLERNEPFNFVEARNGEVVTHTIDFPAEEGAGGGAKKPRLLMWRDSFATGMFFMLVPHFGHALWVWDDDVDAAFLDREKPDVVVMEFVERKLYQVMPKDLGTGG